MASIQQAAWKWAKKIDRKDASLKGAYDAAWEVVGEISEAQMRRRDFGPEMAQAIVEKHLARCQKRAENFRFELELQNSFDDPTQNERRRYEYIASCFRKPESKGSSSMQDRADRMYSERGIGSTPDEEQWWYLFPRELEGNYDALLTWANNYFAQAIETLERMKAEVLV